MSVSGVDLSPRLSMAHSLEMAHAATIVVIPLFSRAFVHPFLFVSTSRTCTDGLWPFRGQRGVVFTVGNMGMARHSALLSKAVHLIYFEWCLCHGLRLVSAAPHMSAALVKSRCFLRSKHSFRRNSNMAKIILSRILFSVSAKLHDLAFVLN